MDARMAGMDRRTPWGAWPWLVIAGLAGGLVLGCHSSAFTCTSDQQCTGGGASGVCQPSGWCSFEDPDCPSMQRYAEHSASELAGTCVPLASDGSTGASDSGVVTTGPASVTIDPDDGPPLEDTADSGGTSLPPPGTSSESSSGGGEVSEASSGTPTACEVVLFDDFEDGRIDPQWESWADLGTSLQEVDSALRFSVEGRVLAGDDAGVQSVDHFDLTAGHLRLEITEPPTPDVGMQLYWQLVDEACTHGGFVQDGLVYAFGGVGEYGPDTRWLQVRFEGELGHLERSVDGVTWDPVIEPAPVDCPPVFAHVLVFGGAEVPGTFQATAAVGTVEACGALAP